MIWKKRRILGIVWESPYKGILTNVRHVHYHCFMSTIIMNSTEVRKNFFTIIDSVVNDGVEVVVQNKNLPNNVRISIDKTRSVKNISNQNVLDELYGSLKSKIPYNPDETTLAHELYAKAFFDKYKK